VGADDDSDVDYYRFSISGPRTLSVTMTPIGFTYLEGPQNANGTCSSGTNFNSLTLSDLGIQVLASNGVTVLATADSFPAGGAETISNLSLSSAGNYYVRVLAGNNEVQLYSLALTLANVNAADLSIFKDDGLLNAVPGTPISYTIPVSRVRRLAPRSPTWSARPAAAWMPATAGSSCPAGGSGSINASVNLAVGGTATFTLSATIGPTATGVLVNTATVAAPGGLPDPNAANNSVNDADALTPVANLAITNSDGQSTAVPGLPVTYTIVVTSAGPSTVPATVSDTPAGLTGVTWTCSATPGSSCTPSGSSVINDGVTLASGGS
jgi:hypothetical protein